MSSNSGYSSLYRRFRPQRFAEVLGQEHVTKALRNAVATKRVGHAYLFSGPRGTGKTSTARILAKALNCADLSQGEPCGICASCVAVAEGRSMDVLELDAASNSGVDAIRSLVAQAPVGTVGEWKVYILDEVHMLTTAASNALLKTLEEPPPHVIFVLATTDPQKVLPTILSRTQAFEFRLLDTEVLESLVEKVRDAAELSLESDALSWVVKRGRGSARDTLSYLDQVVALGGVDDSSRGIEEIFAAIARGDGAGVLLGVRSAIAKGVEPARISAEVVSLARERFFDSFDAQKSDPALPTARLVKVVESLGAISGQLRDSLDPRATLEAALIRLAQDRLGLPAELEEMIRKSVAAQVSRVTTQPGTIRTASEPEVVPSSQANSQRQDYPPRSYPSGAPSPPPAAIADLRNQLASSQPKPQVSAGLAKVQASRDKAGSFPAPIAANTPTPPQRSGPEARGNLVIDRDHLVARWPEIIVSVKDLAPLERNSFNQGRFVEADGKSATFLVENAMVRDRCASAIKKIEAAIADLFELGGYRLNVEVDSAVATPRPEEASQDELRNEFARGAVVDADTLAQVIREIFPGAVEVPKP